MEYPTFQFDEPEGPVFVQVLPAVQRSWFEEGRGQVVHDLPVLKVTSYPGRNFDDRRFLTLRGRRYSVDNAYRLERIDGKKIWAHERTYAKGYQNEAGDTLDWKSGARTTLGRIEERVRAKFREEHPQWEAVSLRLAADQRISLAVREVDRLEGLLREARAEVVRLTDEAANNRRQQ